MLQKISEAIKFGLTLGPIVAMMIGLVESPGGGAEKKAAVVQAIQKLIDEPGGLDCPGILKPYEGLLISGAVEIVLTAARLIPDFSKASASK